MLSFTTNQVYCAVSISTKFIPIIYICRRLYTNLHRVWWGGHFGKQVNVEVIEKPHHTISSLWFIQSSTYIPSLVLVRTCHEPHRALCRLSTLTFGTFFTIYMEKKICLILPSRLIIVNNGFIVTVLTCFRVCWI